MQVPKQLFAVALLLFLYCILSAFAGVCDETSVPNQLRISKDGLLQLECKKPICFNEEDEKHRMMTVCFNTTWTTSCADRQQWFGGFAPGEKIKCCWNEKMKYVTTAAELMLYPNDEFNGEEVRDENKQTAYYNVISNIRKIEDLNKK
uniref:Uncharacterized protein n=1 Tax=Plectus sambesii TaxID=2011161 RepID=A0A914V4J2_9BILA